MEEKPRYIELQEQINRIHGEINDNLTYLKKTDYCSNKSADYGKQIEDLYPEQAERRESARVRINELQAQLPALQAELEQEERRIAELIDQNTDNENGDSEADTTYNA